MLLGAPHARGVVTAAVLWLLDIETVRGGLCYPAKAVVIPNPRFWGMAEAAEGSRAAVGASFGQFSLLMAGGGFSFCILPGTTTANVSGDQVAGFTALLLYLQYRSWF